MEVQFYFPKNGIYLLEYKDRMCYNIVTTFEGEKMFWKTKRVSVINGKRFIAAYSTKPFVEAKKQNVFPDYCFYESDNLYWCLRVGDIEIPWGFGDDGRGYSANGSVIVSRRNVDASSLDGKGLPFIKEGDISYLYESEFINNTFEGYSMYLRDKLLVHIREIAKRVSAEEFPNILESSLKNDPEVAALLKLNMLMLKSVNIYRVTTTKHSQK